MKFTTSRKRPGAMLEYTNNIPVPIDFKKAIIFKTQAQFHPAKYLYGIAKAFEEAGGTFIDGCRVTAVKEDEILIITTERGTIEVKNLVYATHVPPGVNGVHFHKVQDVSTWECEVVIR